MTGPEATVLRYVVGYLHDTGRSPGLMQVAKSMGVRRDCVQKHIRSLQRQGLVTYDPGRALTLRPTERGKGVLQ